MSLLAQVNQPNGNKDASGNPQYYFAIDSTPADPAVSAPFFTATGTETVNGMFNAQADDLCGAGVDVFNMVSKTANPNQLQWSMGLVGVPTGANAGNNFALFAYDDNGAFLSSPISVNRATGDVIMPDSLAVGGPVLATQSVTAGAATTVGGGLAQINGTLGASRVFDAVYNRPVPGAEVLLSQFGPTGTPVGALVSYTPANSGLFTLTMEVRTDNDGYTWTNGTNIISGFLANVAPPFALLSDSFTTCDSLANPTGFFYPSGFPAGVYVKDIVAVINLTAGTAYVPTIAIGGAFNLGTTGGVRFFIQPLIA